MFKEYENDIVANMIKKNYQVRGGLIDGSISRSHKNSGTTVLILLVDPGATDKEIKADKIKNDFKDALKQSKAKYYSIMVHLQCDVAYDTSNIVMPDNPDQPSKPAME